MTDKQKRILQFIGVLVALYAGLFVFFRFADEMTLCITDDWCLSSKENIFLYPLFQILTLVLILAGSALGLWLAFLMLLSKHRRLWFGGFFGVLGIGGILIWTMVLTAEEKSGTWHIPVIGGGLAALGVVFLFFFKPKS